MAEDPAPLWTEENESPEARHYNVEAYYPTINDPLRAAFRGDSFRVGQPAPKFRVAALDGGWVESETFLGRSHLALVFGSYSENPMLKGLADIDELSKDLPPRCELIFVYTREIHPDQPRPPLYRVFPRHVTLEQKMAQARAMRDELGLSITVCVDDVEGTMHRSYGALPFSQVVVDDVGVVVHRSEWASADLLSTVLANLALRDERSREGKPRISYTETLWCASGLVIGH